MEAEQALRSGLTEADLKLVYEFGMREIVLSASGREIRVCPPGGNEAILTLAVSSQFMAPLVLAMFRIADSVINEFDSDILLEALCAQQYRDMEPVEGESHKAFAERHGTFWFHVLEKARADAASRSREAYLERLEEMKATSSA